MLAFLPPTVCVGSYQQRNKQRNKQTHKQTNKPPNLVELLLSHVSLSSPCSRCQFLPADSRECVPPPRPGDISCTAKSRVCSILYWYVQYMLCSVQYSVQYTVCSVQYSVQYTVCSVQYSTDNVAQCLHPVPRPPLAN